MSAQLAAMNMAASASPTQRYVMMMIGGVVLCFVGYFILNMFSVSAAAWHEKKMKQGMKKYKKNQIQQAAWHNIKAKQLSRRPMPNKAMFDH